MLTNIQSSQNIKCLILQLNSKEFEQKLLGRLVPLQAWSAVSLLQSRFRSFLFYDQSTSRFNFTFSACLAILLEDKASISIDAFGMAIEIEIVSPHERNVAGILQEECWNVIHFTGHAKEVGMVPHPQCIRAHAAKIAERNSVHIETNEQNLSSFCKGDLGISVVCTLGILWCKRCDWLCYVNVELRQKDQAI